MRFKALSFEFRVEFSVQGFRGGMRAGRELIAQMPHKKAFDPAELLCPKSFPRDERDQVIMPREIGFSDVIGCCFGPEHHA